MMENYVIVQQFVLLIFGGLGLFMWAYHLGYNKCFEHHVKGGKYEK